MPIFDQGYQHWQGKLSGHTWRWLAITRQGVRAQLRNRLPRLVLVLAWIPALALAAVLVFWGLFEQQSSLITPLMAFIRNLPPEIQAGPRNFRVTIWTIAYQYFFQVEMFFAALSWYLDQHPDRAETMFQELQRPVQSRPLIEPGGAVLVCPAIGDELLHIGFELIRRTGVARGRIGNRLDIGQDFIVRCLPRCPR